MSATAHQSHAYTDGACLYFTFAAKPDPDDRERYEDDLRCHLDGVTDGFVLTTYGTMRNDAALLAGSPGVELARRSDGTLLALQPENAMVLVHARGNLSIDEQDALVREVELRILALDEFASVYSRTGQPRAGSGRDVPPDVIGQITLEFKDWRLRRRSSALSISVSSSCASSARRPVGTRRIGVKPLSLIVARSPPLPFTYSRSSGSP